jgi:hypothetical protein
MKAETTEKAERVREIKQLVQAFWDRHRLFFSSPYQALRYFLRYLAV